MDFTEYLVPQNVNEFARAHGFTDKTIAYTESRPLLFDQFFDWAEEKWGLVIFGLRKSAEGLYEWEMLETNKTHSVPYFSFDEITSGFNIPSKRSARIAACEAIIDYISSKA